MSFCPPDAGVYPALRHRPLFQFDAFFRRIAGTEMLGVPCDGYPLAEGCEPASAPLLPGMYASGGACPPSRPFRPFPGRRTKKEATS